MLKILLASLIKESILLSRDLHSILVLFVMPVIFILIMSLALQDTFEGENRVSLIGQIHIQQTSTHAQLFLDTAHENPFFTHLQQVNTSEKQGTAHYLIEITHAFEDTIIEGLQASPAINIHFSPEIGIRERSLVQAAIQEVFAIVNVTYLAEDLGYDSDYGRKTFLKQGAIHIESIKDEQHQTIHPNSTQQNVPAWLVFSMFFISIPISTTMISERQQKTLMRLRTININPFILYLSKLFPYFIINFIQLSLMLSVGAYLLPLLGGQALNFDISQLGLICVCASVSIAALGYSALVATLCKTTEQATIISGVGSIIFGALGGIMVPTFVMPLFMQTITQFSPMGWGLQAFLKIFVHGEGVSSVLYECSVLIALGIILMLLALIHFKLNRD